MSTTFSASAVIDVPPDEIYAIIADYDAGHPRILPRPPFESLMVEEGGQGAGTVFRATMRVLGRRQTFQGTVTEPEPGRVLVETTDTGYVTTFTVVPADDGGSEVTIETKVAGTDRLLGYLEAWFAARFLRPVYRRELRNLERMAKASTV